MRRIFLFVILAVLILSGCNKQTQNHTIPNPTFVIKKTPTPFIPQLRPDISPPNIIFQPSVKHTLAELSVINYQQEDSPAKNHINQAKEKLGKGEFHEAMGIFLSAAKKDKNNAEVFFWLGMLAPILEGSDTTEISNLAILSLDFAIQKNKSEQKIIAMYAFRQRGIFQMLYKNNYPGAVNDFTECILLGPGKEKTIPIFFQIAYINRGIAHENLSEMSEALQDYKIARELAIISPMSGLLPGIEQRIKMIEQNTSPRRYAPI
ncbi:tetratricopeptide repeat protein [Patescibacteria group bacterium]